MRPAIPEPKYANLPSIEDLDAALKKRVAKLLEDLEEAQKAKAMAIDREDDLKLELEKIQIQTGRTGFRFGKLVFCSETMDGRKTLDKMLLLENGCPAAVLNASFKVGAPFQRSVFKHLDDNDE